MEYDTHSIPCSVRWECIPGVCNIKFFPLIISHRSVVNFSRCSTGHAQIMVYHILYSVSGRSCTYCYHCPLRYLNPFCFPKRDVRTLILTSFKTACSQSGTTEPQSLQSSVVFKFIPIPWHRNHADVLHSVKLTSSYECSQSLRDWHVHRITLRFTHNSHILCMVQT